MPNDCISYQNSGYFTPIMIDYLNQNPELKSLYNRFPTLENFADQILEKKQNYNNEIRSTLVEVLNGQYQNLDKTELLSQNIKLLKSDRTFTVTTGHQLNLFTGPLYFLYKIVSTINLAKTLKAKYSDYDFVPIYWMATEDHDFEEINYFNFGTSKMSWNRESAGAVGHLSTEGLDKVFEEFAEKLGPQDNSEKLKELFKKSYLEHDNLADATRYLTNELFKEYGLVILDSDDRRLKKYFAPFAKQDLLHNTSFNEVSATAKHFKNYNLQVNPREINLFYLHDNLRERIIREEDEFIVNNTEIKFTEAEILNELEQYPERFSPNVVMRPLYQEIILPNLTYIGGGGELAYWLELKSYFDAVNITFPMLLLRNSVLLATQKQADKADKLDLTWKQLFMKQEDLKKDLAKKLSDFPIDFSAQKQALKEQFEDLHKLANQTDPSFLGAVTAQEKKQIKGLENLEKRLLQAQKRKFADELNRAATLQNELFPNQSLQERKGNFSEYYMDYGDEMIVKLLKTLKPLEHEFTTIVL